MKLCHIFVFIILAVVINPLQSLAVGAPQSIVTNIQTTNTEWEYKRSLNAKDFGSEVGSRQPYDDEDILKVFLVRNNRLYEDATWRFEKNTNDIASIDYKWIKDTTTTEYKIWNIFNAIAGEDFIKKNIARFVTFRNSESSVLGYVWRAPIRNVSPSWILGVNANAADFSSEKWEKDMAITLIHEYSHLLTLNNSQVKYSKSKLGCKNKQFRTVVGCALKDSYVASYYTSFWDQDDRKYALAVSQETDHKRAVKLVKAYYKNHPNDFTTSYAATNVEEDIAESFTDFVLLKKPSTDVTKKDRKILFFYQYPELVKAREQARLAVSKYFK